MQLPSGTAASERREGSVADVGGLLHSRLSYWMEEGGGDEFQRHGLVEPCLCHPGQRKARARVGLERAQTTGGGGGSGRERWRWEESPRWTGVGVAGGLWRVGPVTAQDRGQSVVARPQFGCRASTLRQSASCIQPNTDAGAGTPETVPLRGPTNLQYYCTSPSNQASRDGAGQFSLRHPTWAKSKYRVGPGWGVQDRLSSSAGLPCAARGPWSAPFVSPKSGCGSRQRHALRDRRWLMPSENLADSAGSTGIVGSRPVSRATSACQPRAVVYLEDAGARRGGVRCEL